MSKPRGDARTGNQKPNANPMSYQRVIPRDLFNEAKLLKCLGQLALVIHERQADPLTLEHDDTEAPGFNVEQDLNDGALYCSNLGLFSRGRLIGLRSKYNSKDAFPLWFILDDEEGRVFDDAGNMTEKFRAVAGIHK